MEKYLLKKLMIIALVFLFEVASFAQEGDKNVKQKIVDEHGNVSMITFLERSTYRNSDFQQVFKDQFALKEESEFRKMQSEPDQNGFLHERYQLFHKGLKVEFVTYSLHSKQGKLISMNGEMYPLENISTIPKFSKELALSYALRQIDAREYLWENQADAAIFNYKKPEGELVLLPVFDEGDEGRGRLKLAYKFDIYATNPVSRGDLYIDAVNGDVLFYNATIKHLEEFSYGKSKENTENFLFKKNSALAIANADTRYSGSQSIQTNLIGTDNVLSDVTRSSGINTYNLKTGTNYSTAVNFTDADNNWTAPEYHNVNKDDGALDAHWGAEMTYDYWNKVHGRNSYNNAGAAINSYVHYSSAYNNAYWNGSVMTYGDGSGPGAFDILTSLDVCAHEIGHGVCSNTANLAYQKESGALNEALSDIWGACVEYFAAPNKQTWLIGEDIEMRAGHVSLRSLSNPNVELQPDTYGGTYWVNQKCTSNSNNDYCGVHTNSGVLNHWFYILTMGESGTNDISKNYSVAGIGIDKAAKITFRMESVYMTANTTYANARTFAIQSATDLYGVNSPEVIATTNAFYAVGVGAAFAGSGDVQAPTVPANLIASGTTQTVTNLAWKASTDNVGVTGYNVYKNGVQIGTATNTTYAVTGLTAATSYSLTVKAKDAAGNLSNGSNTAMVTTLPNAITYCTSQGNSAINHSIGKIVFNTISNSSTGTASPAGYEDFTTLSTDVVWGTAYTIAVTPTRTSTNSREGYAVFIDYNNDGDFADTGEKVWTKSATNASLVSGTFTIPSSAKLVPVRMRVSMKYNGIPSACEIFANGQVEDYSVNILQTAPLVPNAITETTNDSFEAMLYPNPVESFLAVSLLNNNKEVSFTVISQIGQIIKRGTLTGGGIDVTELPIGIYILKLSDSQSQRTVTKKFIKR